MSLGIYLIPIFVLGSIYLFRSTMDFIKDKKILTMSNSKNNINSLKKRIWEIIENIRKLDKYRED